MHYITPSGTCDAIHAEEEMNRTVAPTILISSSPPKTFLAISEFRSWWLSFTSKAE